MLAVRVDPVATLGRAAPPQVLRCLVVSHSASRRRLIRAAAEQQAWDAIVCRDAGEFLRDAFKRSVPLIVVDLPDEDSPDYHPLCSATGRAKQISDALIVVAGASAGCEEEVWARSLGAWSYLSEAQGQRAFELVFCEARAAWERCQRTSHPEFAADIQGGRW
jgi:hypothetical protein